MFNYTETKVHKSKNMYCFLLFLIIWHLLGLCVYLTCFAHTPYAADMQAEFDKHQFPKAQETKVYYNITILLSGDLWVS